MRSYFDVSSDVSRGAANGTSPSESSPMSFSGLVARAYSYTVLRGPPTCTTPVIGRSSRAISFPAKSFTVRRLVHWSMNARGYGNSFAPKEVLTISAWSYSLTAHSPPSFDQA